jgi:hypothetical protein
MHSFCKRVFSDCAAPRDGILVVAEMLCFALVVCAFIAGTVVNFTLSHKIAPDSCYFTDALIVYVECIPQQWLGRLLSWAWWWTWGINWQIGFMPFSLIIFIPEVVTIWLAARFVRRLVVSQSQVN